ncbi:MAG: hypothetical protein KGZ69_01440 [Methylomonas sp.]|nr:hypothetical protein [Methylomonas sp.]
MIIEHTIKRPNGSHPKMMDGTVYHFMPNESGDHVAEVVNLDHIDWFLNVSTFRIYKVQPRVVEAQPAPAPLPPNGMPSPMQKDVQGAVVLRAVSLSKSKFRPKVVRGE